MVVIITIAVMIIGLIGTIVPGLPGNGLIFIAALGYAFYTDFSEITITTLVILGVLAVFGMVFDYIGGMLGAKKFGATKSGIVGGIVGGLIGLLTFSIIGLVIGQFLGTIGGELIKGRKFESSVKSGTGSLIGYILTVAVNMSIGLIMIVLYIIRVL